MQVRSEIQALLEFLDQRNPRVVLEIGAPNGGSLWLFSRVAAPDAFIVSVDLPRTSQHMGYADWHQSVYRSFAQIEQTIRLVRGDTHMPETAEAICKILDGRKVDFLLIDGDHSYEGVKSDWADYRGLLAPDGVLAFHDIVPGPGSRVRGAPRFWRELKARETLTISEFVESWNSIGVISPRAVSAQRGS